MEKRLCIYFKKIFDSNINSQIILQKVFLTSGQNDLLVKYVLSLKNNWKKITQVYFKHLKALAKFISPTIIYIFNII